MQFYFILLDLPAITPLFILYFTTLLHFGLYVSLAVVLIGLIMYFYYAVSNQDGPDWQI